MLSVSVVYKIWTEIKPYKNLKNWTLDIFWFSKPKKSSFFEAVFQPWI